MGDTCKGEGVESQSDAAQAHASTRESIPIESGQPARRVIDVAVRLAADDLKYCRPTVADEEVNGDWSLQMPRACIPMRLGEKVMGVVVIYSYLEQKPEISPIDRELFNLLADHAGSVLEAARLFAAKTGDAPRTIGAYQTLLNAGESHE